MIFNDFRALIPLNSDFYTWLPDDGSSRFTITYSFPNSAPNYQYAEYGPQFANSFVPVSGYAQVQARRALQTWEEASAVNFVEVAGGNPDIVMGTYNFDSLRDPGLAGAAAFAAFPDSRSDEYGLPGDVFFDYGYAEYLDIWLHEIGHALGLDHPFEGRVLSPELDNGSYTVMSYNRSGYEDRLGFLDIEAIQYLYGPPGSDPQAGNNEIFRFLNTQTGVHFYTANAAERDIVISTIPEYQYEGSAFAVPATIGSLNVYRFYDAKNNVHFYTANEAERDIVINTLSDEYQFEGRAFKAWENQDAPGEQAALHRFYRPDVGTHFYTANYDEFQFVRSSLEGYEYEGVAYYVDVL